MRPPLYILAGGRSRRFGRDKALAELDGRPLIRRIADALRPVTQTTTVVAESAGKYAELGLITLADRRPGLGPLGGLLTALRDLRDKPQDGWLLLCSCDLTEAHPHWVARLLGNIDLEADAVAFRASGRWEPLFALYHLRILDRVRRHIGSDRLAMHTLLDRARTVRVGHPSDWPDVPQINTPEDYSRALEGPSGA